MKIQYLDIAKDDLVDGFHFYERQSEGLGSYFLDSLFSDVESILIHAGVHKKIEGKHRCFSKRFPFAIYYTIEESTIRIHAILDCRRHQSWLQKRLQQGEPGV
jgi:plasmid stabilization system protein ParE